MGAAIGSVVGHVLSDCRVGRRTDGHEEPGARSERLEGMMEELFRLHDLNHNGTLEEVELVKLNEKIAILHRGVDTDRESVRTRYRSIFRNELNPDGRPVHYKTFRKYMFRMLDGLDPDEPTQAMIMDQFIAEADLALAAFPGSLKIRPGTLSALPTSKQRPQLVQKVRSPPTTVRGAKYGGG
mmetsp:Transcript_43658/g.139084  ORF Transcript_43658/g.139084 Transcript_43658/m.139084 type:complete len:183 (-) Transcript_43658:111-659(-)